VIIVPAYRLWIALQVFRFGRTESEKVDDLHAAAAPRPGETDATLNRWVILSVIRCGRVQSDEYCLAKSFTPGPAEAVTVAFAFREAGIL